MKRILQPLDFLCRQAGNLGNVFYGVTLCLHLARCLYDIFLIGVIEFIGVVTTILAYLLTWMVRMIPGIKEVL